MKDNPPELSIETRIVLIRIWSDGFENKKVAGNPQYNSLQLFSATMLPDTRRTLEGLTLPVGLTYKKNHRDVLIHILKQIEKVNQVKQRYWGNEGKVIPTMARGLA
eukprot:scaffold145305_cov46-Cyclotella_meneghiniana.AAC.1